MRVQGESFLDILASLTEDNSGGFMTAQFYLSDELESIKQPDGSTMAETITIQNSQIDQLMSENYSYKNKCENLTQVIIALKQTVDIQLQELRQNGKSVRQNLNSFQTEFKAAKQLMIDTVPRLHQEGVNQCLEQVQQSGNERVIILTQQAHERDAEIQLLKQTIGELEASNTQLAINIDKLQTEYDAVVSESEKMSADHNASLEDIKNRYTASLSDLKSKHLEEVENLQTAHQKEVDETLDKNRVLFDDMKSDHEGKLAEATLSLRRQLTLEHELELDQLKENLNEQLQSKQCEVTAQDAEIEGLKTDIAELQQQIAAQSADHETATERLREQLAEQKECQVAELKQVHEQSVKELFEKLEKLESNVITLEQEKCHIESEHQQQLMVC